LDVEVEVEADVEVEVLRFSAGNRQWRRRAACSSMFRVSGLGFTGSADEQHVVEGLARKVPCVEHADLGERTVDRLDAGRGEVEDLGFRV
jgi:hypothetical protein